MSTSNKPDSFMSVKCTECTNVFSRAVQRGRPRLTCSDECRRTRATLQRRNQGDRTDPDARHSQGRRPYPPKERASRNDRDSEPLFEAIAGLGYANRRLKKTLEDTTQYLPKLRDRDVDTVRRLIVHSKDLRLMVEDLLNHAT